MVQWLVPPSTPGSLYPDSDGKPMADNTTQARWMGVLGGNLATQYVNQQDVFVATDLLWYAQEGEPTVRQAPDVMVIFGRPKGDRGSYQQWLEEGIAPQVVFEILSPGNTQQEMIDKYGFYEEYGVEEYYVFNPATNILEIYLRQGEVFRRVRESREWVSPRLGIRFDLTKWPMEVYDATGERFLPFEQIKAENKEIKKILAQMQAKLEWSEQERLKEQQKRLKEQQERLKAQQELDRSEQERMKEQQERVKAQQERDRSEQERIKTEQKLELSEQNRVQAQQKLDHALQLAEEDKKQKELVREKLRQLGIDLDTLGG
jgi:Uma2 family endonuclease